MKSFVAEVLSKSASEDIETLLSDFYTIKLNFDFLVCPSGKGVDLQIRKSMISQVE